MVHLAPLKIIVALAFVACHLAEAYNDKGCKVTYDSPCHKDCECATKNKLYEVLMSAIGKEVRCTCDGMCTKEIETDCFHGVCEIENKSCKCDSCWTGRSCDMYKNKHKPVFEKASYEHFLPADSTFGSVVPRVLATDEDTAMCMKEQNCPCAQVQYFLKEMKDGGSVPFHIDAHSGEIVLDGKLTKSAYKFQVEARNTDDRRSIVIEEDYPVAIVTIHVTGLRKPKPAPPIKSHSVQRRAITTDHSMVLACIPAITTTFYFDRGQAIDFDCSLYHNASITADVVNTITVTCSSAHLTLSVPAATPTTTGSAIITAPTMMGDSLSLGFSTLAAAETIEFIIPTTVKPDIAPLSSLYLNCSLTGTESTSGDTVQDSALSTPVVYGVYPTVNFTRNSDNALIVGGAAGTFNMKICMPNMNMNVKVEMTSNIEDYLFMKLSNAQVRVLGASLSSNCTATATEYATTQFYGTDRIAIDYCYIQVSGAVDRCFDVDFDLTADDHFNLVNGSTHWIGIGMQTGDRVLWVEQMPLQVIKVEPTLNVNISSSTLTNSTRVYIGQEFDIDYQVDHTNVSLAQAKNVQLYMITTYFEPTTAGAGQLLTVNASYYKVKLGGADVNPKDLLSDATFTGTIGVKVIQDVTPLALAEIKFLLTYTNTGGTAKFPRETALGPLIGTPTFLLSLNETHNNIRQGESRKFYLDILITKLKTPCKVELIMQSENNRSLFTITDVTILNMGVNLQTLDRNAVEVITSSDSNTAIKDMATIDFGTVLNINANEENIPDNKIQISFSVILNCHQNITNGSRYWVGAGMYGEPKMIWVGQISMYPFVSPNERPWLQLVPQPIVTGVLAPGSTYQYYVNITHKPLSECFAYNMTARFFIPSFINVTSIEAGFAADMKYHYYPHVAVFEFTNVEFTFTEKREFTFNVIVGNKFPKEGNFDVYVPVYLTYYAPDGTEYTLVKASKTPISVPVTPPAPVPVSGSKPEYYPQGIAWDKDGSPTKVYICVGPSRQAAKPSCYSTTDSGITWERDVPNQVSSVISHDADDNIHAVGREGKSYMKFVKERNRWTNINQDEFNLDNPTGRYLANPGGLANGAPTNSLHIKSFTTGGDWGIGGDGVYHRASPISSWNLRAKWDCPNCAQ